MGLTCRAKQVDVLFDDGLDGGNDGCDEFHDRVLIGVGGQLTLQRRAVGVTQVGVDVDLVDADPRGALEIGRSCRFRG